MRIHLLKKHNTFQETVYKPACSFLSNPLVTTHSIKRNTITQQRAEELVYVHTTFAFFQENSKISLPL